MRRPSLLRTLTFGCIVALATLPSLAQRTEAEMSAELVKKVLFLRGMWGEDHLVFDADGQPEKTYRVLPFTEDAFEVKSVKLKSDHLELDGQRIAMAFDPTGKPQIVSFSTANSNGHMKIEIRGSSATNFDKALAAIFAPNLASLTPSLPDYWQHYAHENFLPPGSPPAPNDVKPRLGIDVKKGAMDAERKPVEIGKTSHVGGSVKPPRVLKSIAPDYNDLGRALKFSGNVQIYLWVGEDGLPSHVEVIKAVGLGLDEAAVAAVQRYKFAPATKDGQPVTVDLYIEVNFQIY